MSTPASPQTRSRTPVSRSKDRWSMTAPMKLEKSVIPDPRRDRDGVQWPRRQDR
jgi:hypothetical protein